MVHEQQLAPRAGMLDVQGHCAARVGAPAERQAHYALQQVAVAEHRFITAHNSGQLRTWEPGTMRHVHELGREGRAATWANLMTCTLRLDAAPWSAVPLRAIVRDQL